MKPLKLLIILCISCNAFSQDYKFGKVSKAELEETYNPLDSSASATYLYKYRKSYYAYIDSKGFVLFTDVHERIKLYNQDGFDYATKAVRLYKDGSSNETLTGLKAYTYNLVNGKVDDQKLKNDGIFETELSKYQDEVKFTMPNIKEGSIIEYKYTIKSPFVFNVDEFVLQEDIPVKKLEAIFESPEYYNFKINTKGYLSVIPEMSQKTDAFLRISQGITMVNSQSRQEYRVQVYNYNLNNVPALRDEPYVNNINNYRSAVKFELSYTQFPNGSSKSYSSSWDDVVKTIYQSESFGEQLNKTSYFNSDVDQLLAGISDPIQKAGILFDHVKNHMKWNGFYSKYTDVGVRKAYKDQTGNTAEINLMLTSMLRYAGLNANPVLVSTRNNGVPLFPTREGYNYVISAIEVGDGIILMDATSVFSAPNLLPYRVLNWEGRLVRKGGSSTLVNLYPNNPAASTTFMNINIEESGVLSGKIRNMKTNHNAMNFRESYILKNKEEYLNNFENNLGELEISNFEVKNDLELSKPIIVDYDFVAEDQYETIGDKLFLSPLLFFTSEENPFKLESREYPVDFGYPSVTKHNVNIKVPEGFKVESVPSKVAIQLPENLGSFTYNVNATETNVQLAVEYSINVSVIHSDYYDVLKEFFKQLVIKEKEKVVLAKI